MFCASYSSKEQVPSVPLQPQDFQGEFYLMRVLFFNQMTFHKNGAINCHNFHYYSDENPHAMRIKRHRKGSIFLRDDLVEVLENVPLTARRSIILQHDGFSAHYSHAVRAYLDIRFLDSLIGRRGPVRCALPPPPR